MTKNRHIIFMACLILISIAPRADALDIPPPLLPWVQWVLHDHQDDTCPPNQSGELEKIL